MVPVLDLGRQALANDFCLPGEARQGFYPLCVMFCKDCGLAQLSAVVDREAIYRRYAYVSSASVTMQRHYDRLFLDILSEQPDKMICEIASNDGGCLQFAKSKGFSVLGVDPARNLAALAEIRGIPTIAEFFNPASAELAKAKMPMPGVILARHCFAHVDDWCEFMAGLELLATKDTLIVFEFPYVLDTLRNASWSTLYHEHLSVISLKPLAHLLQRTKFHIHRVQRVAVHGGAVVVMLRHDDHPAQPHLSADEMLAEENVNESDWRLFALKTQQQIDEIRSTVQGLRKDGKIVAIMGASAKTTVICNACGFDKSHIEFVSDNSPLKPGKLVPGTDIPVIDESEFLAMHADYAIMGAWNFEAECLAKMDKWRKRGGKFIVPGKELRIV